MEHLLCFKDFDFIGKILIGNRRTPETDETDQKRNIRGYKKKYQMTSEQKIILSLKRRKKNISQRNMGAHRTANSILNLNNNKKEEIGRFTITISHLKT